MSALLGAPGIAQARRGDRSALFDRAQPDARVLVAMRISSLNHLDGILGEAEPAASAGSSDNQRRKSYSGFLFGCY